ncbi:MAG: hypothetical protein ACK4H7_00330, partial [Acidilobaceae archaeon]
KARDLVRESDIIVLTHYHYDHYLRNDPELYYNKTLIVKDYSRDINVSQRFRGYRFLVKTGLRDKARLLIGDNNMFKIGGLAVELSKPVWHGEPGTKVGKVLMARIRCEGESLIFTSDVQGPADPEALTILEGWSTPRPSIAIVGGPPTYFSGTVVSVESVEMGLRGLAFFMRRVKPETLVVDHHLLRDLNYRTHIRDHEEIARELNIKLQTAAEYEGRAIEQLEARRRELWRR